MNSLPTFDENVKRFARGEDAAWEMIRKFSPPVEPYEGQVLELFMVLEEWQSSAQSTRAAHAAKAMEIARTMAGY